jgi:hypothetical protein
VAGNFEGQPDQFRDRALWIGSEFVVDRQVCLSAFPNRDF